MLIFCDYLQKIVECPINGTAVKSRNEDDHIKHLRIVLDLIRAHQLKLNPMKSFLGVFSSKFLGFV